MMVGGPTVFCVWGTYQMSHVFEDYCGNKILQTLPSPDGKLKAVLFHRDCGAVSGSGEQVSLLRAGESLTNEAGDVFVADVSADDEPQTQVRWQNSDHLVVKSTRKERGYRVSDNVRVSTGFLQGRTVQIIYLKP